MKYLTSSFIRSTSLRFFKLAQQTHQEGEEKAILQSIMKQVSYPKGTLFGTLSADTSDTQISGESGVVAKLVQLAGGKSGDVSLTVHVDGNGTASISGTGPGNLVSGANSTFSKLITGAISKYKDKFNLQLPANGFDMDWVVFNIGAPEE